MQHDSDEDVRTKVHKWWKEIGDRDTKDIKPIVIISKKLDEETKELLRKKLEELIELGWVK